MADANVESSTGKVEAWAFGGAGILRREGLAIFIPHTCPGDTVNYRISKQHKSYAQAVLLEVLDPSPQRISPICPVYEACGGCQLQHVRYEEQLLYKQRSVMDALHRIGGLKIQVQPVKPASVQWNYRRHITLHVQNGRVGYIGRDNSTLIEPKSCHLFSLSDTVLSTIRSLAKDLPSGKVYVVKEGAGFLIEWTCSSPVPPTCKEILASCQKNFPAFLGGVVRYERQQVQYGLPKGTLSLEGKTFHFELGAFIQNHPEQSATIYADICRLLSARNVKNTLDLYSGIGIISCLLASQGIHITSIESNASAVAAARSNSRQMNLSNCKIHLGNVEKILPRFLKQSFDAAFINPPRTGMDKQALEAILGIRPRYIAYLSCMPPTLARDLKQLSSFYNVVSCQPYDMFPQTSHVETLVFLEKI